MRRIATITLVTALIFIGIQIIAQFPHQKSLDFCFESDFQSIETTDKEYSIVLGNSRSLDAIHSPSLSEFFEQQTMHLGYSSSDLITAELTLQFALKRNPKLKRVFIEISPFHFDSRRVHSHGIRHYFFQKEPILLLNHGESWTDFSTLFPRSSTIPQLKSYFSNATAPKSDFSKRWNCNEPGFKRETENWNENFKDRKLRFEEPQKRALLQIFETCDEKNISPVIIFCPTDTMFQSFLFNYFDYKEVTLSIVGNKRQVIDLDDGTYQDYLKNPDHIACPQAFTQEVIIPAIVEMEQQD